jgi:hypothetical protein
VRANRVTLDTKAMASYMHVRNYLFPRNIYNFVTD